MCGRYVFTPQSNFFDRFEIENRDIQLQANYNVSPRSVMPVVVKVKDQNQLHLIRWGFIPSWAKKLSTPREIINARAETVAEKNSFRSALQYQRCLIPASGFYEWKKDNGAKTPYYFYLKDKPLFSFAGLYNDDTFTIITTAASPNVESIHNRMPVILPETDEDDWLGNHTKGSQDLISLLQPYSAPDLEFYPVSTNVNKTDINSPELIKPV